MGAGRGKSCTVFTALSAQLTAFLACNPVCPLTQQQSRQAIAVIPLLGAPICPLAQGALLLPWREWSTIFACATVYCRNFRYDGTRTERQR